MPLSAPNIAFDCACGSTGAAGAAPGFAAGFAPAAGAAPPGTALIVGAPLKPGALGSLAPPLTAVLP